MSRNSSLDFLRGLAILVVVFHHTEPFTIPGLPEFSGAFGFAFWKFRLFGSSGVDLFFVLSGFLVGGLLIQEISKYGKIQFTRFFLRRGLKIWPSYFIMLAVLAIVLRGHDNWLLDGSPVRNFFVHGFFLQNYLDQTHNTPTWTLAIEEHFYLILPFVIMGLSFFGKLRKIGYAALLAMFLCFAFRLLHLLLGHQDNDFMFTHNRFDGLFFGVFLAWAWREYPDRIRSLTRNRWLIAALVMALISPAFFFARKSTFLFTVGFPMLTVGYGLLLLTAVSQGFGIVEKSIIGKGICKVGLWSYNIYLWHFFLPLLLAPVYRPAQLWLGSLVPNAIVTLALQVTLYAGISIAAGWFFTRFVEGPFLKLRDKLLPSRTAAVKVS